MFQRICKFTNDFVLDASRRTRERGSERDSKPNDRIAIKRKSQEIFIFRKVNLTTWHKQQHRARQYHERTEKKNERKKNTLKIYERFRSFGQI